MKIKTYPFKVRCVDNENEKWNDTIMIRAISLTQATKEFWNTISEHLELETLISVTIENLPELGRL